MLKENIYKEWELHPDATQLEIKYKFFIKFIDILSIKSLVKNDYNHGYSGQINNPTIIRKWQEKELKRISDQFDFISNYSFPDNPWFSHSSIFYSSLFKIGDILNTLKVTNYKSNQLEIYYEPRMFQIAQKLLPINVLEEWVSMLTDRLFTVKNVKEIDKKLSLKIKIDEFSINNVVWFLENLCLTLKEIYTWYINQFVIKDVPPEEKQVIVNIMNHMIVYALTDFYVKLQCLYFKTSFHEIYEWVLSEISKSLEEGKFALEAYKNITLFISRLITDGYIDHNDTIVKNFLSIIKISCSPKNQDMFIQAITNSKYKEFDNKSDEEAVDETEIDNSIEIRNEIEKQSFHTRALNKVIENDEILKKRKLLRENEINNIPNETKQILKTIQLAEEILDKAETSSLKTKSLMDEIDKKYQKQSNEIEKPINLKSILSNTKKTNRYVTDGEIICTSRIDSEGD